MVKSRKDGRPAVGADAGEYQKRVCITIDSKTRSTMERLGHGNLSAGIRIAAGIVERCKCQAVDDLL